MEGADDCALFTIKDLEEASLSLKNKKAPGPERTPLKLDKQVCHYWQDLLGVAHSMLIWKAQFSLSMGSVKAGADQLSQRRP